MLSQKTILAMMCLVISLICFVAAVMIKTDSTLPPVLVGITAGTIAGISIRNMKKNKKDPEKDSDKDSKKN